MSEEFSVPRVPRYDLQRDAPPHSVSSIFIAAEETFRERNAIYKDNWVVCGEVMKALFPVGVSLVTQKQQEIFSILTQIVGKLTRFAASGCTHQDSIHDLMVYAAIVESVLDENTRISP